MKIIVISATLVDSKAQSFTSSLVAYDGHSCPFLTSNPNIEELYKEYRSISLSLDFSKKLPLNNKRLYFIQLCGFFV